MTSAEMPALFQPIRVGNLALSHRVILAPLTRTRAYKDHVPGPQAATYYAQRGSTPGTLLITEATSIAPQAGGLPNIPGIWNEAQVAGWKEVTDSVHAKGSYIFLQIWAMGRAADVRALAADGDFPLIAPSPIAIREHITGGGGMPRALTIPEIQEYIELFAEAAKNAMKAGFDGVEVHGANGFLIDQFVQDVSNIRDDEYGGSVENRCKFALEVVDAVVQAIGASRTSFRMSPWSEFQNMGMRDPVPTYTYLTTKLAERGLAYLHVVEPRGSSDAAEDPTSSDASDFIRQIWGDRPYIAAGGFKRALSIREAEEKGGLIAFGRLFISNPDLPYRLQNDMPLTPPDRSKFYLMGNHSPLGYTDWPFADDERREV
ncbi:FMN-linked oxidoreductase [Coniophora puteana RWD-64-598 SS2]|uniref:FMN-linked oxidoreductase n=1 Tax=Coniophora puteana (strain RWD-64-598) TaxID=741705 RepID=A0A5M3M8E3_CONPW|nr:FMN-linked oxidoreductase [Coniophora puteana RWD-64-598 SS2]EIW75439.1 FMN-linked oxidoreductase [Coniophora puteana RWD-64-598 SS2]